MDKVYIGKGKIDGKGVYANKDLKKGEMVINYKLKSLNKIKFSKLSNKETRR